VPVDRIHFNPKRWSSAKFRLTLWCEHSRLPLPALNGNDDKRGVYELEITHKWFKRVAPFLKLLGGTLRLVLPAAASTTTLFLDDTAYKLIEEELDFGQTCIEVTIEDGGKIGGWLSHGRTISGWLSRSDSFASEHGESLPAQGGALRELRSLLKQEDLDFGGLVRVQNKRQEFLWVHSRFETEY
jgi:hypothetical protein